MVNYLQLHNRILFKQKVGLECLEKKCSCCKKVIWQNTGTKFQRSQIFETKKLIKNQAENHWLHQSLIYHGNQTHKDFLKQERLYEQNKKKMESSKNKKSVSRNLDD